MVGAGEADLEPAAISDAAAAPQARHVQAAQAQQLVQQAQQQQAPHPRAATAGDAHPPSAAPQSAVGATLGGWADPAAAAAAAAAGYGDLDVIDLLGDDSDVDLLPLGQLTRQQHNAVQPAHLMCHQQQEHKQLEDPQRASRQLAVSGILGDVPHADSGATEVPAEVRDQQPSLSQMPLAARRQQQQQRRQAWHGQEERADGEALSYSQMPLVARQAEAREQGQLLQAMPEQPGRAMAAAQAMDGGSEEMPGLSQVPLAARAQQRRQQQQSQQRQQRQQREPKQPLLHYQLPTPSEDGEDGAAKQPLSQLQECSPGQQRSQPCSHCSEAEKGNEEGPSYSQMPLAVRLRQRREAAPVQAAGRQPAPASGQGEPPLPVAHQQQLVQPHGAARLQPGTLDEHCRSAVREPHHLAAEAAGVAEDEVDVPLKALKERRCRPVSGAVAAREGWAGMESGLRQLRSRCAACRAFCLRTWHAPHALAYLAGTLRELRPTTAQAPPVPVASLPGRQQQGPVASAAADAAQPDEEDVPLARLRKRRATQAAPSPQLPRAGPALGKRDGQQQVGAGQLAGRQASSVDQQQRQGEQQGALPAAGCSEELWACAATACGLQSRCQALGQAGLQLQEQAAAHQDWPADGREQALRQEQHQSQGCGLGSVPHPGQCWRQHVQPPDQAQHWECHPPPQQQAQTPCQEQQQQGRSPCQEEQQRDRQQGWSSAARSPRPQAPQHLGGPLQHQAQLATPAVQRPSLPQQQEAQREGAADGAGVPSLQHSWGVDGDGTPPAVGRDCAYAPLPDVWQSRAGGSSGVQAGTHSCGQRGEAWLQQAGQQEQLAPHQPGRWSDSPVSWDDSGGLQHPSRQPGSRQRAVQGVQADQDAFCFRPAAPAAAQAAGTPPALACSARGMQAGGAGPRRRVAVIADTPEGTAPAQQHTQQAAPPAAAALVEDSQTTPEWQQLAGGAARRRQTAVVIDDSQTPGWRADKGGAATARAAASVPTQHATPSGDTPGSLPPVAERHVGGNLRRLQRGGSRLAPLAAPAGSRGGAAGGRLQPRSRQRQGDAAGAIALERARRMFVDDCAELSGEDSGKGCGLHGLLQGGPCPPGRPL